MKAHFFRANGTHFEWSVPRELPKLYTIATLDEPTPLVTDAEGGGTTEAHFELWHFRLKLGNGKVTSAFAYIEQGARRDVVTAAAERVLLGHDREPIGPRAQKRSISRTFEWHGPEKL